MNALKALGFAGVPLLLLLVLPGPAEAQAPPGAATKMNLDLPFEAEGPTDPDEIPIEWIEIFNVPFEGDGFFFCCDLSGSMKDGTKLRRLQREVMQTIAGFSREVQFGLVFFDAGVTKFPPSGRPAEAIPAMKGAAEAVVMSLKAGVGTCPKPALLAALSFARQSTSVRKQIIYLSDGFTTCPGLDPETYGRDVLAAVAASNTERVRINTLCIGPAGQVDEAWMKALAARTGGSYVRLVDP